MSSPYFSSGASASGSPYFGGGGSYSPSPAAADKPKKKGGGGILGTLEHIVTQGPSDLYHMAANVPAGIGKLASDVGKDIGNIGSSGDETVMPWDSRFWTGPFTDTNTGRTIVASAKGVAGDLRHPLRHPGNTLIDVLPFVNVLSKAALVTRAAKAGEIAGPADAVAAMVAPLPPGVRPLAVNQLTVNGELSNSATGRLVQQAVDSKLQAAAGRNPSGVAAKALERKVGRIVQHEARMRANIAKTDAAAVIALGRKLSPAQQKALQVVAEEAPLDQRIAASEARAALAAHHGNVAEAERHVAETDLLRAAKEHVDTTTGTPSLTDPGLQNVLEQMRLAATNRENLLGGLGMLTDTAIQNSKTNRARSALGATYDVPERTFRGPEFTASPDAIRVPDVPLPKKGAGNVITRAIGAQRTIGHLRAPGSTTHEFTGALRDTAQRRQDTTRLVGESSLEAAKFAEMSWVHALARKAATAVPTHADDIAVRLENLSSSERMPLEVTKFLADPEKYFGDPSGAASVIEKLRTELFIDPKKLSGTAAAEFERLNAEGKVGWVPRRVLGDLQRAQAPLQAVAGSKAVKVVDTINNASRFAILYLKPAYAIPNLLGNAALNILQQGFAAPGNLARAARLNAKLGPELTARIDALMGEGAARAISAHGQGPLSSATDWAAAKWSTAVDTPFRRSSFLHEAGLAGYTTPAELRSLLKDRALRSELSGISLRASREIIDYGNLGPIEKEIIRRVVFFYPWVKGSTVYAGRMLRDKPVASAVQGQLGQMGQQYSQQQLGDLPSYLEGLIPLPGGKVLNPAAASVLGTPAQAVATLGALFTGDYTKATDAAQMMTPALSALLATLQHRNLGNGRSYPAGTSAAKIAYDELVQSLPLTSLIRDISQAKSGEGKQRIFPPDVLTAVLKYNLGSAVTPQKLNAPAAHRAAASEKTHARTGR